MGWIDDTEKYLHDTQKRDSAIEEQADVIYNGLWDAIKAVVSEARKIERFSTLATNGNPEARVVQLTVFSSVAAPSQKSLCAKLMRDKHRVAASSNGVAITLDIDIGGDNVAFLSIDGDRIDYNRAAFKILFPFLYPGVPEPKSKRQNWVA